jgi:superfamily II DNA or RNA helicase
MSGCKKQNGDFKAEDVESVMNKPELIGDVVREWQSRAAGRPTIAFASTVKHSLAIAEAFNTAGIAATHVDANTDRVVRDQILSRLASGDLKVVSNVDIYTEGADCPPVSCIIDDAITASLVKYLQRRGRGGRPYSGKENCIVLDHAGNAYFPGHGLPSTPREWSLDEDRKKKKSNGPNYADTVKVCPKCGAAHDLDTTICSCGYVFSVNKKRVTHHKPGELEEISENDVIVHSEAHMRRQYEWFLLQQHTKSKRDGAPYSKGYAFMKYQSEFKKRPKRGWRDEWVAAHADLVRADTDRRRPIEPEPHTSCYCHHTHPPCSWCTREIDSCTCEIGLPACDWCLNPENQANIISEQTVHAN